MRSAFGIDHGVVSKKIHESARKGAEAGAIVGGGLGATRGVLQAAHRAKPVHAFAREMGHSRGVANAALVGHAAGKGIKGAAIGAAGIGALGYALRPRNPKQAAKAEQRRKKALIH